MKSHVGRFVALISAPAVLLLTLTLPVVDDKTGIENEFIDEIVQEEEESDEGLMRSESLRYEEDQVRVGEVAENEFELLLVGDDSAAHDSNFQMGRLSPRGTPIQDLSSQRFLPSMIEINNNELIDNMEGLEVGSEDEEYISRSTIARWLASLQCILAPSFCLICLIYLDKIKAEKFVIGSKIKLPALMNQIQLASSKNLSTTSSYPSSPPSKLSSPSSESPNSNSINLIHPDSHSIHSNLSNQYK
ncbi:hypothetical protein O181_088833 [Austropuccinia psidii MF-1]|uniref:Uncharacterized protein n=1 Tax=Austropuccinia psidii MF-1 TaxID=1389203 RepID=A0A9Q3ISB7_9BASI|nr:hypothetical protein [Austropuccinia psidii MF-1]